MRTLVLDTWLDDNINAKITFEYYPGSPETRLEPEDPGEIALVDVALVSSIEKRLTIPLITDPYDVFHPTIISRWEEACWELVAEEGRGQEPDEPGYDVDAAGTFSDEDLKPSTPPLDIL